MPTTYPRWFPRVLYVLMALAVLVRLFYWHYTGRVWEDSLIAVLHSENAVRGLGLTHLQPAGEGPVQGFTSPLGVLIPLIGDLIHIGWGLPFIKLVSAFAAAIAVWLGARISQVIGLPVALALTAAGFLAFEHHQILWGAAGLETEIATAAYLCSILALQRGNQWQKGLSLGFVLLVRPDGAIWVLIAFAVEIWRARKAGSWRGLIPVAAGVALLYGPWLIFTTAYYGSPIPNSINAKELGYPSVWVQMHADPNRRKWLWDRLTTVISSLGGSYDGNGTGFQPLWHGRRVAVLMTALSLIGAAFAIRRRQIEALLVSAFGLTYGVYLYVVAPYVFGWYTPPVVAALMIAALYGLFCLSCKVPVSANVRTRVLAVLGAVYVLMFVCLLPRTFRSDKYLQMYIENGVRKQMGIYLGEVTRPTDTIASESLGYVGYYSRRVVYDYPGMCSRDSVRYLRQHPGQRNMLDMMHTLHPTYLVLRPGEYQDREGHIRYPWLAEQYELARVFRADPAYREKLLHPEVNIDTEFDVFRARDAVNR